MALRGGDIIAKKATTIAIVNQKGGTAKTTTCENLGIGLAMEGKKVLLVDVDPQGSLTISMGWQQPDELPTTLSTLMQKAMNDQPIQPGEGILHHAEGVDLIPANIELAGMEVALVNSMNREKMLKQVLDSAKREYDYYRNNPKDIVYEQLADNKQYHELLQKKIASQDALRSLITEMFLSAGQRSTSRLSRFDSEQHPLSRFPSRSIKKGP